MKETEWVKTLIPKIEKSLQEFNKNLKVSDGIKLTYSSEIVSYTEDKPLIQNYNKYQTDILVLEHLKEKKWKPRIIIETKINKVTTHDAITYSQKAQAHKNVHPFLRYGILIGNHEEHALPGRLIRHGQHFDFMNSWKTFNPDEYEWNNLISILISEIEASKTLDELIYNSRSKSRVKYASLHRPLILKK